MDNLELWKKINQPEKRYLKKIFSGRLKGKSDINPQWRLMKMTEMFGKIGTGWNYSVKNLRIDEGGDGEKMATAEIELIYKENGKWSEPITGIGGAMFVINEKRGIHTNDECFKMAITDALSVAMKQLGMAADIYMGLWDGSKYQDAPLNPQPKSKSDPQRKKATSKKFIPEKSKDIAISRIKKGFEYLRMDDKEKQNMHQNYLSNPGNLYMNEIRDLNKLLQALEKKAKE